MDDEMPKKPAKTGWLTPSASRVFLFFSIDLNTLPTGPAAAHDILINEQSTHCCRSCAE